ncbi:hypothetical protein BDP27DRAFT_1391520 [Rhodocollybia butyracea]|uniref:Vacuolar protein sorting-associated protein 51 homolog n=1 Tax=Rhodocollybia butyracea TaxID=206335 RepID=A0A9P5Q0Z2_9AGAR|nr:hypothetical protein BDP27DRAFT_1391520 [Rhodocollybia butyracea]
MPSASMHFDLSSSGTNTSTGTSSGSSASSTESTNPNSALGAGVRAGIPVRLGTIGRSTSVRALEPEPAVFTSPKPPSTPPARTTTRARDLLRKHYGLGIGTPSSSGRGTPDERDPMNMDSPSFDAKAYYSQLITTANLSTLLKKRERNQRQNLVYNHHHELIAASDTIGAMKSHAESLDADLDLLKAAFSEISRLSSELASME